MAGGSQGAHAMSNDPSLNGYQANIVIFQGSRTASFRKTEGGTLGYGISWWPAAEHEFIRREALLDKILVCQPYEGG